MTNTTTPSAEALAEVYISGAAQAGMPEEEVKALRSPEIEARAVRLYRLARDGGASHQWALDEVFSFGYDAHVSVRRGRKTAP